MCSEVMYGAYYPYLYGRAGPSRPFYQYDRFNQDLYPSTAGVPIAASASTSTNSHSPCSPLLPSALSSSSTANVAHSSHTPSSIPLVGSLGQRHVAKEEDLTIPRSEREVNLPGNHNDSSSCSSGPESPNGQGENSGRTQYVSATCVVVTHYSGDVANVVDEHFTRALNFNDKNNKDSNPMSARNFPPSFWNSNYVPPTPAPAHHQMSDLYSTESSLYSTEPWVHNAAHYGSYAAHAAYAHHHNMAQYGSLLHRLPQQYGHSSRLHHDQQTAHALESAAAAYSNYPMSGLEAQVQESSKDLYWF
ncbi:CLUMA_CG013209, isoform A [Clunio marinus]|uniref:CLUMA_CG013209, isoform A n=1 Tax=Clunio marinus TaxID=568069 RepID=A0A1J1IJG6_9DIPT|nr:CLUMA_CG013209, isoform A [Clunio marinus]